MRKARRILGTRSLSLFLQECEGRKGPQWAGSDVRPSREQGPKWKVICDNLRGITRPCGPLRRTAGHTSKERSRGVWTECHFQALVSFLLSCFNVKQFYIIFAIRNSKL